MTTENPHFAFGLQQTIDGYGRHEVVIDHSSHGIRINEMSEEHLTLLLSTYRRPAWSSSIIPNDRLKYVLRLQELRPRRRRQHRPYAQPDHRHARRAGQRAGRGAEQQRAFYQARHRCIFCSLIDEALTFEATLYDRESGEIRRKINVGQFVIERSQPVRRHQALCQPV